MCASLPLINMDTFQNKTNLQFQSAVKLIGLKIRKLNFIYKKNRFLLN